MSEPLKQMRVVGHPAPRVDAVERCTGKAQYTNDMMFPGMLYARILRSPHPHARIRSVDTRKAASLRGVKAILTHENCNVVWGAGSVQGGRQYSDDVKKTTKQRRYAFNNPVRFVGEPVAAVAAVNRHVAEEAIHLITVDYEVLEFVIDPEKALKSDAVQLWPEGNLALDGRNEAKPFLTRRGDMKTAFETADFVFEDRYSTAFVHNAQMEPRACVARWDGDQLTVYTPTGGVWNCRHDIARDLGIPDDNVRVICRYMGGNFGNKNQNQDADLITAMLAKQASAPVKLELSRKDDFLGVHGRWPTTQHYKVGLRKDGLLQAIQLRGYSGMGPYRKNTGAIAGIELYHCPNVDSEVYPVYTNRTVSGNFRGPEFPQGFFGIQSMMDDITYKIGIDPVAFILKNSASPVSFTNYTLEECLSRGAAAFDWSAKWRREPGSDKGPVKRGAGVSFMLFRSGLGRSDAAIEVNSKGKYTVFAGVTDVGAGAKTTMSLIAAEELGVPLSDVSIVWGDTGRCPYSVGESGSRTTIMTGGAVIEAARDLNKQIAEKGMPSGAAVLMAKTSPNPSLPPGKIRNAFGAHFVEVEVDMELGHVRVLRYVAVQDCGRLINPLTATAQIQGAAIMGIGQALHEELLYDRRGQPLTAGYYGARIATHMDAPPIEVIWVESDDGYGPYGAKSMGESGIILGPAAVANAIFNATGKRMKDLPITRARLLGAKV